MKPFNSRNSINKIFTRFFLLPFPPPLPDLFLVRPSFPLLQCFFFLSYVSLSFFFSFPFIFFFYPHFLMPLPFLHRLPPLALLSSPVKVSCLLGNLAVVQSVAPSAFSLASCLAPGLTLFTAPSQCCPLIPLYQLPCCPAGPSPSSLPCQLSCTATRESASTLSQELLTGC